MKENQNLKNQLEDTKTTLAINKELLFNYISNQSGQYKINSNKENVSNNIVKELYEENNRVTEKLNLLFNEKIVLEKKVILKI